ncbi:MAG: DHH family phosphoesterase [Fenollaria massiliensis]
MKSNNSIKDIGLAVENASSINIISHKSPDGDNMGSTLGLYLSLKEKYKNKTINIIKPDDIPSKYKFIEETKFYDDDMSECDVLLVIDCADERRLLNEDNLKFAKKIINIDHHKSNKYFGDINYVLEEYSSSAEIVYDIIKELDFPMNKEIATMLYIGMDTDTGRFMYSSTTDETMQKVSKLMSYGIDINEINIKLYRSMSKNIFDLYKLAINKINFYKDFAYLVLENDDFLKTNTSRDDTDDILAFLQGLEDYDMIAIIKEVKDIYKVSLRSKYKYDVGSIGEDFDGGGHKYAAGLTYKGSLDELVKRLKGYVDNAN